VSVRQVRRVLFSGLLLAVTSAYAQSQMQPQAPGDCPPPMPGHGPGPGAHMGFPDGGPPGHGPMGGPHGAFSRPDGTSSTMRGGLQLGPPGRWWDDPDFAKDLNLTSEQKSKMDDIFNAHKAEIFGSYTSLLTEESALEKVTQEAHPDETALFSEIDRIARARASLEKANAHMLLAIRREMNDKQLEQLESHRHFPGSRQPGS
jgi:Spy/CpxP family protein refolding chaperone